MEKVYHFSIRAEDMHHGTGRAVGSGEWESEGTAGTLLYGPYKVLPAGPYTAALYLKNKVPHPGVDENTSFVIDVISSGGRSIHQEIRVFLKDLPHEYIPIFIDFDLPDVRDVEVRLMLPERCLVSAEKLVVYPQLIGRV